MKNTSNNQSIWKKSKENAFRTVIFCILSVLAVFLLGAVSPDGTASAETEGEQPITPPTSLESTVSYTEDGRVVNIQKVNGSEYLFLPSTADLNSLSLQFKEGSAEISNIASGEKQTVQSGTPFDLTALGAAQNESGGYEIKINELPLTIMASDHIASMYLISSDPDQDRKWVEKSKVNKAKGSMIMVNEDGSVVYNGKLKQIKGRGNSSWEFPKKPYQIKLDQSADLIETGLDGESSKTWVLLANYLDHTLLQNQITFYIADQLGLNYTPHCRTVDLYYDGEYRGTYLLSEKTEVGSSRVDVDNLETAVENANPDFDTKPVVIEKNADGTQMQYVSGLQSPENITGGYLLELDYSVRAKEEKSWFSTQNGQYVTVKCPEYASRECVQYISALYKKFEDSVFNSGINSEAGKLFYDYADLESLAKFYLMEELSGEQDAYKSSSYFYKYADDEKLYSGPVWDFDIGYGYSLSNNQCIRREKLAESVTAGEHYLSAQLLKNAEFRSAVKNYYNSELRDIVLGTVENVLPVYREQISQSVRMNSVMWPDNTSGDASEAQDYLKWYLEARIGFFDEYTASWKSLQEYEFYDIEETDWFYGDVMYASENNIMNGYPGRLFLPQNTLTRAMAAVVIYRISGSPTVEIVTDDTAKVFTDVPYNQWYTDAVAWAAENGIVNGVGNQKFNPNAEIRRQDFVTIIKRWMDSERRDHSEGSIEESDDPSMNGNGDNENPLFDELMKFADWSTVSDYAAANMNWAITVGLIHGDDKSRLNPLNSITRAEAAAILHRFMIME